MASVSAFAGPVTRTFRVHHNARVFSVQLFHNTVTGDRSLSIDGAEVTGTSGRTTVFQSAIPLLFEINGVQGSVTITPQGAAMQYKCIFDGAEVPEENTVLNGSANWASDGSSVDADANRLKITIEAGDIGSEEGGKPVVLFRLHTVRELDLRETTVHRRFRDFSAVNDALRSAYKGSHLLSSFPSLPPKSLKLFEDHLSVAFIEKRRWQLQDWMHKISQIPRIRTNPDYLTFLGLIDNVREYSMLFPRGSPLGLTLRAAVGSSASSGTTEVTAVTHDCPVANAALIVRPGDKVSKINGEDVLDTPYEVIIAKLKAAPRPLCIYFIGVVPPAPGGSATNSNTPVTIPLSSFTPAGATQQQSGAVGRGAPTSTSAQALMGIV